MPKINDLRVMYHGADEVRCVYWGAQRVWCAGPPPPVWLAVWDNQVGDVNYPQDALGDTPGTYARVNVGLPQDTWLFPTAADMGIPLTATLDTITVEPIVDDDTTFDLFYKTGQAWDDRQQIQRKRFYGFPGDTFSLSNKPATWLQYGLGLQIYTGNVDSRFYGAQLTVDWSY